MISVKKNLLDLKYNKYVQFFTTTIIIFATYAIGLALALVTNQVTYSDPFQLVLVLTVTLGVCITSFLFIAHFQKEMKSILNEIRGLDKPPSSFSQ